MTGSGDAAFTRSFNPYTSSVLNGGFMKGAIYEPLVVATVAGGGHIYPWLAQSWKWSNGNKTLTLKIQPNVKWSDGKPLTADDVVYSLKAGKQDKAMDIIGLYRAGLEHRLDQARRRRTRRNHAQDARLAVHRRQPEPAVRRAEAHLVEGRQARRRSRTRSPSAPARSRTSRA